MERLRDFIYIFYKKLKMEDQVVLCFICVKGKRPVTFVKNYVKFAVTMFYKDVKD